MIQFHRGMLGQVCLALTCWASTTGGTETEEEPIARKPVSLESLFSSSVTTFGCPSGWYALLAARSTRCFRVFWVDGLQRAEASARCRQEQPDAELVTISYESLAINAARKIAFANGVTKKGSHKKAWIGLMYDPARKKWVWPDGAVANFTAWFNFGGPADPEGNDKMCTQLVGGLNGTDSWISEACENGKESSTADAFMCDVPRLMPGADARLPLASRRRRIITCCNNGMPKVNDDIRPFVSNWHVTRKDVAHYRNYEEGCLDYSVSFNLDESAIMPDQDASVKCKCTGPGLDSHCNQECRDGDRDWRTYRCNCHKYNDFGKLCELHCYMYNGITLPVSRQNLTQYCRCREHYYGEECDKVRCLNGGTPNSNESPSRRSCNCVSEKFTGRYCEREQLNEKIEEIQHRGANVNANANPYVVSACAILIIIPIGCGIYCCARRLAKKQLHRLSRTVCHVSAVGDVRGDGNLAYTPSGLSSPNTTFTSSNSGYADQELFCFPSERNPHPGGNPQGGIIEPPHLMGTVDAPPSYDEAQTMTSSFPPGGNFSLGPAIISAGTPVPPPDHVSNDLPTYEDALKSYPPLTANNSPM